MRKSLSLFILFIIVLLGCSQDSSSTVGNDADISEMADYMTNDSLRASKKPVVGNQAMSDAIVREANELYDTLVAHQRHLHQHPEVGGHLPATTAYVKKALEDIGYEPIELIDSGLVVLVGGKNPGKTILIRADMDALPVKEHTGLPWSSINDFMHACGHDFHTAMLLGVAQILKNHEDKIQGTVKLMFQPDEESGNGARDMIEAGIMENPRVDAAIASHVFSQIMLEETEVQVGVGYGYTMASATAFEVDVQGAGTHGSMPERGVDPIMIGSNIMQAWQTIIAREVDTTEPTVLTFGQFHAGTAPNVIPGEAKLGGTLRTFDVQNREFVLKRMKETAEGIAISFRGSANLSYRDQYLPALYSNPAMSRELLVYANQVTDGKAVFVPEKKVLASEDFSRIANLVPAVFFGLQAPLPDAEGRTFPNHHPMAMFDPKIMPVGVATMAYSALQWLSDNS